MMLLWATGAALQQADPNYSDNDGQTALFEAASERHQPVVQLFLEKGADLNHSDNSGQTTLLGAARGGNEKVIQLLLNKGADQNHSGKGGWAVLRVTVSSGHGQ